MVIVYNSGNNNVIFNATITTGLRLDNYFNQLFSDAKLKVLNFNESFASDLPGV